MNSAAVKPLAPSAQPALELIALAQLPPKDARLRLRELLLANPNHFGNVPSSSFSAVLNIQQDTTYESISRVGYNKERQQLNASLNIWQSNGYSSKHLPSNSREYIRFYLSCDGGTRWLDQGIRSMSAADSQWPGCLSFEVTLPVTCDQQLHSAVVLPRVRAILSWNSPPPAGAPAWIPSWGNVLESELALDDAQSDTSRTSRSAITPDVWEAVHNNQAYKSNQNSSAGHLQLHSPQSSKVDPHHRFLAFALAKAAGYFPSGICALQFKAKSHSLQAAPLALSPPATYQS